MANLSEVIARMKEGDANARKKAQAELFDLALPQLEKMARKKLDSEFGRLRFQGIETGDVLQEAVLRFLERLKKSKGMERITCEKDFFVLAAHYIRWTLLDAGKKLKGNIGRLLEDDLMVAAVHPFTMNKIREVHEEVEKLPEELRDVVDLLYYQDFGQEDATRILGVSRDTVKRRFKEAKRLLKTALRSSEKSP